MNTLLFRDLLESRGYRVGTVADGDGALACLERSVPDLIVLDIVIPGTNGFELLKLLKDTEAWRAIPVMVVSGLPPDTYRQPIMAAGCAAFIAKPMSITTFLTAVAHLVSPRPRATKASARLARCLDAAAPTGAD